MSSFAVIGVNEFVVLTLAVTVLPAASQQVEEGKRRTSSPMASESSQGSSNGEHGLEVEETPRSQRADALRGSSKASLDGWPFSLSSSLLGHIMKCLFCL